MTAYLTSVGVQQFSINIGSGQTTGSATINAVGSGAFILFGGINPQVGTNPAEAFTYLTLTNSTTITATRSVGIGVTMLITGCIVDGDTLNLIKSVQYGTVTIANAASSGTSSISAVTNANTAIHLLGWNTVNTTYSGVNENPILTLSGTTVTASRQGTVGKITVGFVVVEFQPSALNQSVQNVSATSSSSVTSYTASISSVVTNNTICLYAGSQIASVTTNLSEVFQYGSLTSSTVFTANIETATANAKIYNCSVIEFVPGVLAIAAQRGVTSLSSATSNTSSITSSLVSASSITWLGNTTKATSVLLGTACGAIALTNATTVTITSKSTSQITGSWEVANFTTINAIGASLGIATVSGVGASNAFSFGFSSGAAIVSGISASNFPSTGTSLGAAVVTGATSSNLPAVGSSLGSASVSGISTYRFPMAGASSGSATVSGVSSFNSPTSGSSLGSASVLGVSAPNLPATGVSIGAATVSGVSSSNLPAVGFSSGVSIVSGRAAAITTSVGSSVGQAIVTGIVATLPRFTVGLSMGTAIVNGVGNASAPQPVLPPIEDIVPILLPPIEENIPIALPPIEELIPA